MLHQDCVLKHTIPSQGEELLMCEYRFSFYQMYYCLLIVCKNHDERKLHQKMDFYN